MYGVLCVFDLTGAVRSTGCRHTSFLPSEVVFVLFRCVKRDDMGILTYAHDTDGHAVGSLDHSDERERLEREQRKLSRKEQRSKTTRSNGDG